MMAARRAGPRQGRGVHLRRGPARWRPGIAWLPLSGALWGLSVLARLAPLSASPVAGPASASDPGLRPLLLQKLRDNVSAVERSVDGVMGVTIVDLQTGERLGWNQDAVFPAASAIKLPILIELLRQSQLAAAATPGTTGTKGTPLARLTDSYTLRAKDVVADSNILSGLGAGAVLSNQDLATFMVVVSDNSATNVLIDRVGMMSVNALLDRLGLTRTRLRRKMADGEAVRRGLENTSTPAELAKLWELLYRGQILAELANSPAAPASRERLGELLAGVRSSQSPPAPGPAGLGGAAQGV